MAYKTSFKQIAKIIATENRVINSFHPFFSISNFITSIR